MINRPSIILFALIIKCVVAQKKLVCYYPNWSTDFTPDKINFSLCTHFVYAFAKYEDISAEIARENPGEITVSQFISQKAQHSNVKYLISVGGGYANNSEISKIAASPELRDSFAQNAVNYCKKYNFDGVDLDWEVPTSSERENFVFLLHALYTKLKEQALSLSIAVPVPEVVVKNSYLLPCVARHLDFINLMAYDMRGQWNEATGMNAPLYKSSLESDSLAKSNIDDAVTYWLQTGVPSSKLILGIPGYGTLFKLKSANSHEVGAPTVAQEVTALTYRQICINNWTRVFDIEQQTPYAYFGDQWIGYDDVESVKIKADYINKRELGGAMIWSLNQDDYDGSKCGQGKFPLLSTISKIVLK